jgi:hypothetical protein
MKRPIGMTLLSFLLIWLALGGVIVSVASPILAWADGHRRGIVLGDQRLVRRFP